MQGRQIVMALALVGALVERAEAAPEWCSTDGIRFIVGSVDDALEADPYLAVPALITSLCSSAPTVTARKGELDAARAKWSKALSLTDAEWADVATWAVRKPHERQRTTLSQPPASKRWSEYSPMDQYAAVFTTGIDPHYVADALATSATGRFGYVMKCLELTKPVEWAICQPDLDAIDRAKVIAEVRADARSPVERMNVRLALYTVDKRLAERKKAIAALSDPAYPKLFALAAEKRSAFRPSSELLALALAMDDARITESNKAYEGCEDKTWSAFAKAVTALGAKAFTGLKDEPGMSFVESAMGPIANDPDAYLAAIALHACEASKGDFLVSSIGNAMIRWPGFRGPRSAALTAIATAGIQLDARGARLEMPQTHRAWLSGKGGQSGGGRGVVSKVKPGDKPVVEFVTKSHKEKACANWRDNNKVIMYSSSGAPIYGYDCLQYKSITVTTSSPPRTVKARYAAGVKPGMYASIAEDVVGIVAKEPGGTPTHVLGIAVK